MGEERLEPVGRNAAFGRLAADVHLQQHILHDAERDGAALIASPMLRGGMSVLLFPAADSAPS